MANRDTEEICRRADILVAVMGWLQMSKSDGVRPGATAIDAAGKGEGRGDHASTQRYRPDDDHLPAANTTTTACRANNPWSPKG